MEQHTARRRLSFLIPETIPTPQPALSKAVRRLDVIIYSIHVRRATCEDTGDLLSMLHTQDDSSQMTDQQLRDEAMALFLGARVPAPTPVVGHLPVAAPRSGG